MPHGGNARDRRRERRFEERMTVVSDFLSGVDFAEIGRVMRGVVVALGDIHQEDMIQRMVERDEAIRRTRLMRGTHRFDPDTDRCVCGGEVVYFEDGDNDGVPGEGCEVSGLIWAGANVGDAEDARRIIMHHDATYTPPVQQGRAEDALESFTDRVDALYFGGVDLSSSVGVEAIIVASTPFGSQDWVCEAYERDPVDEQALYRETYMGEFTEPNIDYFECTECGQRTPRMQRYQHYEREGLCGSCYANIVTHPPIPLSGDYYVEGRSYEHQTSGDSMRMNAAEVDEPFMLSDLFGKIDDALEAQEGERD